MVTKASRSGLSAISKYEINWGDWLAPALILVMPFVNFLEYRGYGLFHTESLLAMAILAGLGLIGSLLIALRQQLRLPFLRRILFVRPLVFAFFLSLFLDVQPEFKDFVVQVMSNIFWDGARRVLCALIFFSIVFIFFYIVSRAFKQNAGIVFSTVFTVTLSATILLPPTSDIQEKITRSGLPAPAKSPRPDLPPIVHIVLDEHIGAEGVPEDVPGSAALRAELKDFYVRNGFRLYGRAFSAYYRTINSISNLVNGVAQPYDMLFLSPAGAPYVVTENAWFDGLISQGYRIRVYQSEHLNFCAGKYRAAVGCTTYPINGLGILRHLDMPIATKVGLLIDHFSYRTATVRLLQRLPHYMRKILRIEEAPSETALTFRTPANISPLWTKAVAEGLIDDLRSAKPGEAYFAHLLIPHFGFILDENCRAKSNLLTWYDHTNSDQKLEERLSGATRPAGYVERYVEYFKQVRCTHRMLDEMFRSLSDAGVMDEATVIVHSDHGSRISSMTPLQIYAPRITERDVLDNFSTLYAIRSPGVPAGYDPSTRSVQALFAEQAFGRMPGDEPAVVFLTEEKHASTGLSLLNSRSPASISAGTIKRCDANCHDVHNNPRLLKLAGPSRLMIRWSCRAMPSLDAASWTSFVTAISAFDGVASPDGWLWTRMMAVAPSSSARLTTSRG